MAKEGNIEIEVGDFNACYAINRKKKFKDQAKIFFIILIKNKFK